MPAPVSEQSHRPRRAGEPGAQALSETPQVEAQGGRRLPHGDREQAGSDTSDQDRSVRPQVGPQTPWSGQTQRGPAGTGQGPRQSCSSPRCLPSFSRGRASLLPGVCGRGPGLSCLQGWGSWPPGAPRSLWTSSAPWPAREPPGDFLSGAKGLRPASSGWDASVSACLPGAGRPLRHRASRQPGALGRLSRLILSF